MERLSNMKIFTILFVTCLLGSVLCETREQQVVFTQRLYEDIKNYGSIAIGNLRSFDVTSVDGVHNILKFANTLNFDINDIICSLQHLVINTDGEDITLPDLVFKLSNIRNELEKSFISGPPAVKDQLITGLEGIIDIGRSLHDIILISDYRGYTTVVVRHLDNLVTAVQKIHARVLWNKTEREEIIYSLGFARVVLRITLNDINSTDKNVYNNMVEASSKVSSGVGIGINLLKDLLTNYKYAKPKEIKDIIYMLVDIVHANDEAIYKSTTVENVVSQLRVTLDKLTIQYRQILDAAYGEDGKLKDEDFLVVVLPEMFVNLNQLQRSLERTIDNYIHPVQKDYYYNIAMNSKDVIDRNLFNFIISNV